MTSARARWAGGGGRPGRAGWLVYVTARSSLARRAEWASAGHGGRLDLLVNNARAGYERLSAGAWQEWNALLWEQPLELFDATFNDGVRPHYDLASRPSQQPHRQHLSIRENASFQRHCADFTRAGLDGKVTE